MCLLETFSDFLLLTIKSTLETTVKILFDLISAHLARFPSNHSPPEPLGSSCL